MTDTSTQPPAPQGPSLADQITNVIKSAPELGQSPGLAVGVATNGGDISGNSQSIAHATNTIAAGNSLQNVGQSVGGANEVTTALDWFGNHIVQPAAHDVANAASDVMKNPVVSTGLNWANKPLQIAQHEYRYLHDVEARHGPVAALADGLGVAAAAVGGTMLTGSFYGGELAAEGATYAESQYFYKDSWQRTNSTTYADPNTGRPVSLGRDVSSLLGLSPGTTTFKITSGLMDGAFDLQLGGPEGLGLLGKAHSAEGMGGILKDLLPGTGVLHPEDVQNVYDHYGAVRRAFSDIASKSAGEIAATPAYKSIAQQSDLLKMLGEAQTPEDVLNVYRDMVTTHALAFSSQLPSMNLLRAPLQATRQALRDTSIPGLQRLSKASELLPEAMLQHVDDNGVQHLLYSNKEIDPTGIDTGTRAVYAMARYVPGINGRVAASVANAYAMTDDIAQRVQIFRNLQLASIFNMAGLNGIDKANFLSDVTEGGLRSRAEKSFAEIYQDPQVQKAFADRLDNVLASGMFGKSSVYGVDDAGNTIGTVHKLGDSWEMGAGLTLNQTGKLQIMDLRAARRAAKYIKGSKDFFGSVDDFAFDHFTQPVFKRFVLLTPSYAMHIAMAEAIPNAMRLGLRKLIGSGLQVNARELGARIDAGDANAMEHLVWRLIGGKTEDAGLAAQYVDLNGAKTNVPSNHDVENEAVSRQERFSRVLAKSYFEKPKTAKSVLGNTFRTFGAGEEQFTRAWSSHLWEVSQDPASQAAAKELHRSLSAGKSLEIATDNAVNAAHNVLQNLPEEERAKMLRARPDVTSSLDAKRPADIDPKEWARLIVANVRGVTRGADRNFRMDILKKISDGEHIPMNELDRVPLTSRPYRVKGREIMPNGSSAPQRIADLGFKKILGPMVDFMSRQPIGFAQFKKEYEFIKPLVDEGLMTQDEAMVLANSRSMYNSTRNIHNLTDRTQWTTTFRNWAPFYFAQEQAYRRMGRLLAENPRAFRQYQLMISNMHNVGTTFQGPNGSGYLVLPGTGFLTQDFAKAAAFLHLPVDAATPVGMGWNLSASSVIFPLSSGFRVDLGPVVSIPLSAMDRAFPESWSPVLKADFSATTNFALGPTNNESLLTQLIPNVILQRLAAVVDPSLAQTSFNSTMAQTLQTLAFEDQVPPPTANIFQQQAFIDRVKNQTRLMYFIKLALGAITPVSPEVTNQVYNSMNAQVAADIKSTGSISAGLQLFLSKNPNANAFTVFHSYATTGVSVPASVQAENWINDNMEIIRQHPSAMLLMPPNTDPTFNQAVYNEQIAQGFRQRYSPADFANNDMTGILANLYTSAGNAIVLGKWLPQFESQIAGMTGTQKYDAEQAFYGSGQLGSGTLGQYGLLNPVWWKSWQDNLKAQDRASTVSDMKVLLAGPNAPKTPIANDARMLLAAYDKYQSELPTAGATRNYAGMTSSQVTAQWKQTLYSAVASYPQLSNLVNGLFTSILTSNVPVPVDPGSHPGSFAATAWNKA